MCSLALHLMFRGFKWEKHVYFKCITTYTQFPVYWVHLATTNAAEHNRPVINPPFMKVVLFGFPWNSFREVLIQQSHST